MMIGGLLELFPFLYLNWLALQVFMLLPTLNYLVRGVLCGGGIARVYLSRQNDH